MRARARFTRWCRPATLWATAKTARCAARSRRHRASRPLNSSPHSRSTDQTKYDTFQDGQPSAGRLHEETSIVDNTGGTAMGRSVILGGARTPFGRMGGTLAEKSAVELGTIAAREALARSGVDSSEINHLFFGQVLQAGSGQIPSRQVGFGLGLDSSVTSDTINRVCGSGMRAVTMADIFLRAGEYQAVIAGGMESMSNAPYLLKKARFGYRLGNGELID